MDVDTKECLAIWASESRTSFHAYVFLKEVLKYCENRPEVVVDRGFWYKWALKRLGLKYRHERKPTWELVLGHPEPNRTRVGYCIIQL